MFRKMRLFKKEVSKEACERVLDEAIRGILSVNGDDDYPYGLPIDYVYDKDRQKIYFHSAQNGHKIDALKRNNKASFCVCDEGYKNEGEWAWNITSVIVFGRIRFLQVGSDEARKALHLLGDRYFEDKEELEYHVNKSAGHVQMLEMSIDHMSGKFVKES